MPLTLDLLNPKSEGLGFDTVSTTINYRAEFQVIPIRGFRFVVLTQYTPHTHTHTHEHTRSHTHTTTNSSHSLRQ